MSPEDGGTSQAFAQSGEEGEVLHWTHCGIPLRFAEKVYELVRLVYFASLRLAARSAAAPADWAEDDRYEAASVLTTVTSQVEGLPPCHGINVRPSGFLPSSLAKPNGKMFPLWPVFQLTVWRMQPHHLVRDAWLFCLGACLHYYYYQSVLTSRKLQLMPFGVQMDPKFCAQ